MRQISRSPSMLTRNFCFLSLSLWLAAMVVAVHAEFPGHNGIPPELQYVSFSQGLARMEGADQVQVLTTIFKPVWQTRQEKYNAVVKFPVTKEVPKTKEPVTTYKERMETHVREI